MKRKAQTLADMLGITIPEDTDRFVELSMLISDAVAEILDQKGWTQKDLAKAMGKTPAEVSKWLSGTHNLTLKSIAKLETALGEKILNVKCPDPVSLHPAAIARKGVALDIEGTSESFEESQTIFAA